MAEFTEPSEASLSSHRPTFRLYPEGNRPVFVDPCNICMVMAKGSCYKKRVPKHDVTCLECLDVQCLFDPQIRTSCIVSFITANNRKCK